MTFFCPLLQLSGSLLRSATPQRSSSAAQLARTELDPAAVDVLEGAIDEMEAQLPPLTNFILPGGCLSRFICLCGGLRLVAVANDVD